MDSYLAYETPKRLSSSCYWSRESEAGEHNNSGWRENPSRSWLGKGSRDIAGAGAHGGGGDDVMEYSRGDGGGNGEDA